MPTMMSLPVRTPRPVYTARLQRLADSVDKALERLMPQNGSCPQVVAEAMRYCVSSGGKRFRPLLAIGACEAAGGQAKAAMPVACALECIHTYSLVHDDLPAMDNADERRGQPTCHRKFGEGNAVLVGDALLTLSFELLTRDGTPNALAIIQAIGRACGVTGLIGGQVLDLQVISRQPTMTEDALREIAARKTGALMAASVVAGALAGKAREPQIKALKKFGEELGLAFQLIDDVHDQDGLAQVMGTEAATQEAKRLLARATDRLKPFGAKAKTLQELAGWLGDCA